MTDDTLTDIEKRWRKGVLPLPCWPCWGRAPCMAMA